MYQHTDIAHGKWLLRKMLLWFLCGLYFLHWITTAACNSFILSFFFFFFTPHPFIPVQFISSACHSSYWYMLRGCSLTGNLITPSSTCQFRPSLCQPTLLFIASTLQFAILLQNKRGSPDCHHWLQTYGSWITNSNMHIWFNYTFHSLVCLSIGNVSRIQRPSLSSAHEKKGCSPNIKL